LYRFQNGNWTNYDGQSGLGHRYIWSVAMDAQNRVWVGTWGGGLHVLAGDKFEELPELQGFPVLPVPVTSLANSASGGLFVGTGMGLFRYQDGKATWLSRKPELLSPDVRAIREGADGTVWFGMSGGGLGCYQKGAVKQFRREDGLSSDYVQCLQLEADDTLWIGTFGGGLNRLKAGRFNAINKNRGLPNDVVCSIQDDGLGFFWLGTHGGIVRVSKDELNRCADGGLTELNCLTYGLSDGMPTLQCSGGFQPASCKTADGRLWFPTSKGLVAVDPRKDRANGSAPAVVIEKLLVDDQPVFDGMGLEAPLQIVPGRHRFQFQYTGLSFAAPEKVRFKYRVEGLEAEWTVAQSPRRANYSHIPPGDYRFQVRACNDDGVWSEDGASLAFTVLPAFWQTWWFRIFGGVVTALAGGGIVWLDARWRMQRKLERLGRQQAIERERARIAKDIHDDLGAGLTRISLLSESVPADEISPPQAAEVLSGIFTTTREMTQTMDEIVWAVNPQHDTLDSLASYLGNFAQEFLAGTGVRCRLDVPLQLPNWRLDAEVRHNLFLAVKESLNNALRHAQATEIRVSLSLGDFAFVVMVEDNGRGISAEALNDEKGRAGNRNGLSNMRQRLAQIGGRCEIGGSQGRGTRVEFQVTLKRVLN
jgi:signal transduction histidine kinase